MYHIESKTQIKNSFQYKINSKEITMGGIINKIHRF